MDERKKRISICVAIILIIALVIGIVSCSVSKNENKQVASLKVSEDIEESSKISEEESEISGRTSKPTVTDKKKDESSKVTEESSKEDSEQVEANANAEDTHVEESKPSQGTQNSDNSKDTSKPNSNSGTTNSNSSKPAQSTPNTNNSSKPSGNSGSNNNNSGSNSSKPTQSESKPAQEAKPAPHVHNWVEASSKAATCTSEGSISYKCTGCSETKSETTAKASHNWVHHHEDEVSHKVGRLVCKCGWSVTEEEAKAQGMDMGSYHTFFHKMQLIETNGTSAGHSYDISTEYVVDSPAVDYDVCNVCGATK